MARGSRVFVWLLAQADLSLRLVGRHGFVLRRFAFRTEVAFWLRV